MGKKFERQKEYIAVVITILLLGVMAIQIGLALVYQADQEEAAAERREP